jgi:hypothetical protein
LDIEQRVGIGIALDDPRLLSVHAATEKSQAHSTDKPLHVFFS